MNMKKLSLYGMVFLAAALTACAGNTTPRGGENDSDSVMAAKDSMPEGSELEAVERLAGLQTTMAPVPLYTRSSEESGGEIVQVVYWTTLEKSTDDDDPERHESWAVQEALRTQVQHYTKVLGLDGKFYGVKYVGEAKSPDNSYGSLASMQHPQMGLKFKIDDPAAFVRASGDTYMNGLHWLLSDAYLNNREMLKVKSFDWDERKPLPANLVKKMEEKYGMKAQRTGLTTRIGEDYLTGFIQFAPKGKKCLAVEVLACGDEVWSYSDEAQYFEDENLFTWHVDDEGEYYANSYDAAFIGPDGIELLYTHWAAESAEFGWITIKGDQLVRHVISAYYIWYD